MKPFVETATFLSRPKNCTFFQTLKHCDSTPFYYTAIGPFHFKTCIKRLKKNIFFINLNLVNHLYTSTSQKIPGTVSGILCPKPAKSSTVATFGRLWSSNQPQELKPASICKILKIPNKWKHRGHQLRSTSWSSKIPKNLKTTSNSETSTSTTTSSSRLLLFIEDIEDNITSRPSKFPKKLKTAFLLQICGLCKTTKTTAFFTETRRSGSKWKPHILVNEEIIIVIVNI